MLTVGLAEVLKEQYCLGACHATFVNPQWDLIEQLSQLNHSNRLGVHSKVL